MAIDANVAYVETKQDGSGTLHLCDRVPSALLELASGDLSLSDFENATLVKRGER